MKYTVIAQQKFTVEAKDNKIAKRLIEEECDVCTVGGYDRDGAFNVEAAGNLKVVDIKKK